MFTFRKFRRLGAIATAAVFSLVLPVTPGQAEETLSVEIGKAQMFRLQKDPSVVVVGDPTIADVVIEEGRVIFLVGLQAGETNVYILDDQGRIVLERDLVVKPTADRHVTVHRGVEEATMSCNPRCAGDPNPSAEGSAQPANASQQAAAGAASAGTALNPLAGLAAPAGNTGGSDPTQLLQGLVNSGLLGGTQPQQ